MLTLWGAQHRFCDRISRRDFLQVGALGLGGLTLPDILRLRAEGGAPSSPRAVIMICLVGGPSHVDMYDLKPDAPAEYRGEFKPIKTNVPGFDICEHMPLQARIADKLALVRTVQFVEPINHELHEVYTGFPKAAQRPSFGAVISRFRGAGSALPSYVTLDNHGSTADYENPRYVGAAHRPLEMVGDVGMLNFSLGRDVTRARLADRRGLMEAFDGYRRDLDRRREGQDMDTYTARALDIITSSKTREAFDLSREPPAVRDRYGSKDDKYIYLSKKANSLWEGERFLLARRLLEAGVAVVTLRVGGWDHHGEIVSAQGAGSIFIELRSQLPLLDRSIHALVTDLHERGLDKEVLVLIWGEFGRTPRISRGNGREHWTPVGFALFAGAIRGGQVVGVTDSRGGQPKSGGVGAQNVFGTIYHALGIDYKQKLVDFGGRPIQLLDDGEPIAELVG